MRTDPSKIIIPLAGIWAGLKDDCYLPGIYPTDGTSLCAYVWYTQEIIHTGWIYLEILKMKCLFSEVEDITI